MYNTELYHYGVGHLDGGHSGRYPWGSGERPKQSLGSRYIKSASMFLNPKTVKKIKEESNDEDTRQKKYLKEHVKKAVKRTALDVGIVVGTRLALSALSKYGKISVKDAEAISDTVLFARGVSYTAQAFEDIGNFTVNYRSDKREELKAKNKALKKNNRIKI